MINSSEERLNNLSPLKKALFKIEKYKAELANLKSGKNTEEIAVIGMALDFPNAKNTDQFWKNLIHKKDAVTSFPNSRKNQLEPYYKSKGKAVENMAFQEGAYLDHIDQFDYEFFKFPAPLAATMHPLQRMYLHTSWRALEDAGALHPDNTNVGVFFGASGDIAYSQYIDIVENSESSLNPAALMGNTNSITSSRVSYFMDLKGPAVTLDTACSSSLVAVHQACNALQKGDCEIAIAGGGKLYILPEKDKYHVGFESPTGKTKPFAANSDGAGIGEGVGAVVLKKLDKAIEDNDCIYAVIKGSAINQDGTSSGVIAPNPKSQTEVILQAAERAGITLDTLSYIETHGTGTQLGDPIEFQALKDAFRGVENKQFCALGAVKSNIGHLFEAAGVAGLIKCVLALQHKVIPPSINHESANTNIDFLSSPFYLNTEVETWKETQNPRRCGISSFGISGTNAHVILEEYIEKKKEKENITIPSLFTLSAHSKVALKNTIETYINWLSENTTASFEDICYATNTKKGVYDWRFAVKVNTIDELKEALKASDDYIAKSEFTYTISKEVLQRVVQSNYDASNIELLIAEYKKGGIISWKDFYRNITFNKIQLPVYPLQYVSCWPVFDETKAIQLQETSKATTIELVAEDLSYDEVYGQLSKMIKADTGIELGADMAEEDFFDLGIDSIIIMQFIQTIQKQYGVKLEMGQFYEVVNNLGKLTEYIINNGSKKGEKKQEKKQGKATKKDLGEIDYFVPYKEIDNQTSTHTLTEEQASHLNELVEKIARETQKSKQVTQQYRKALANNRNVAGFKPETKEITYQIIAESAQGSKIKDLDGNEYVDLTMGFGVNLLGYNPDFIQKALQDNLALGYPVGPMNETAGQVAALITEMTGNERVAFYNSGSEAIMVALRLARATTGRAKYVIFKESYHGTFDGVLALNNPLDIANSIPLAPGITDNFIENTIVLEYGSKEAISYIEKHAHELAAVLIEPVQSRRPEIQPTEFLKEVRRITKENGTAFIFDEVITGFRIHPGGAQAWYGIKADLCTYGKVVGGGMPVGVVAGTAEFMDAVDGGDWQFGDASFPNKPTTFVAGTFNQHPLTMTASLAILTHLKKEGTQLQEGLNTKTQKLVDRLNTFFKETNASIKVVRFGSLFRFVLRGGWELFYQHLLANKIYVWEGRNCFLSTAHTEEDVEHIYQGVVKSTQDLLNSGWGSLQAQDSHKTTVIPFTEEQMQLYTVASVSDEASSSFNENQIVDVKGHLSIKELESAFECIVNRHEALRTITIDEAGYHVAKEVTPKVEVLTIDVLDGVNTEEDSLKFLSKRGSLPFNLSQGPFIKLTILKIAENHHKLLLTTHHLVGDGYSIEVIWSELSEAYSTEKKGAALGLLPSTPIREFNKWFDIQDANEEKEALAFWKKEFAKKYPKLTLPSNLVTASNSKKGHSISVPLSDDLKNSLIVFSKENRSTIFNVLFSCYTILLHRLSGQTEFVVGIPASGQLVMGEKSLVGQCVKMLPLFIKIDENKTFAEYLSEVKNVITNAVKYQQCSFQKIIESTDGLTAPKITTEVDMNSVKSNLNFEDLNTSFYFPPVAYAKYELSISIIELEDKLSVDFYYNTELFEEETITNWTQYFVNLLEGVEKEASTTLAEISIENQQETTAFSTWNNL